MLSTAVACCRSPADSHKLLQDSRELAAIVNINLAVVNALPLPALDGGFLALLLAEAIRGRNKLCSKNPLTKLD